MNEILLHKNLEHKLRFGLNRSGIEHTLISSYSGIIKDIRPCLNAFASPHESDVSKQKRDLIEFVIGSPVKDIKEEYIFTMPYSQQEDLDFHNLRRLYGGMTVNAKQDLREEKGELKLTGCLDLVHKTDFQKPMNFESNYYEVPAYESIAGIEEGELGLKPNAHIDEPL
jgi:hypothetical protein